MEVATGLGAVEAFDPLGKGDHRLGLAAIVEFSVLDRVSAVPGVLGAGQTVTVKGFRGAPVEATLLLLPVVGLPALGVALQVLQVDVGDGEGQVPVAQLVPNSV